MRTCTHCEADVPRRRHYCPMCLRRLEPPVYGAPPQAPRTETGRASDALVLELVRYGLPTGEQTAIERSGAILDRRTLSRDGRDHVTLRGATPFERLHLRRDVARFERDGARWRVCCDAEDTSLVVRGQRLHVGDNTLLAVGDELVVGGVTCVVRQAGGGDDDAAQ